MSQSDKLSPEKYDGLARSYIKFGIEAQNDASYDDEGANPELDFSLASQWQRIADLIRERVSADDNDDTKEVRDKEINVEALKSGVIEDIKALTQTAPLELSEERHTIFRKTRSATRTNTHSSSNRKVNVSDIRQSTFFLGNVWDESRKFRVTEYDGTKQDLYQYETYALVATHFDIDQGTSALTITQQVSPVVSPEHQAIFPSLEIEKKPSDEQWSRLAKIVAR